MTIMSEIWNFTPSLESQVKECIAAASKNENNKWLRHFGYLTVDKVALTNEVKTCENPIKVDSPVLLSDEEEFNGDHKPENHVKSCDIGNENYEMLNELIESDISSQMDYITKECLENPNLLLKLANQLPMASIDKLFKHIYGNNTTNVQFLNMFFKSFLPALIKREYNSLMLDLILKCSEIYPREFAILLTSIIKDVEVPNKVLQDYVLTLNETEKAKYLLTLSNLQLTKEEFIHNIFSIYTAYKDCTKSEEVHNFVQSMLIEHHTSCVSDRNYGRLLLTFLQSQKNMKVPMDYSYLEKIIILHRSPFQRPSLNILNELKDEKENRRQLIQKKDKSDSESD